MPEFKPGYIEDLKAVKEELIKEVNTYLDDFSDLKDKDGQWKSAYSTSIFRLFSSRGEEGYLRAIKLLKLIESSRTSEEAIELAIYNSGDSFGKLQTMILDHLREKLDLDKRDEEYISKQHDALSAPDPTSLTKNSINKHFLTECLKRGTDLQQFPQQISL